MLNEWFELFIKERRYLKGSSELTIKSYRQAYNRYVKATQESQGGTGSSDALPTKAHLNSFVIHMREYLAPTTCNISIRSFNAFLSWLYENEYTEKHLKIKQVKEEKKVLKTFSEEQLRLILSWKPATDTERRLHALLCLLVDTGIRIEEALTLAVRDVDFDNLILTVRGKGNKQRVVPMSLELRKVLWRHRNKHTHEPLFATRSGGRCSYHNMLRDFQALAKELGIKDVRVSFHTLRHTFAYNYVRNGGNLFYLQKALGHSSLQTTRRYVELQTKDLQEMHLKTSLLSRLK
jgi:integrase/recombinase XerD